MTQTSPQLIVVDSSSKSLWERLQHRAGEHLIFHDWDFMEIVKEVFSYRPQITVVVKGSEPVCGAVFWAKSRMGLRLAIAPFFIFYNPFLLAINPGEPSYRRHFRYQQLSGIITRWAQQKFHVIVNPTLPGYCNDDVRPFLWSGWKADPAYSAWVEVDALDSLPGKMDATFRRVLNQLKNSHNFHFSQSSELQSFYDLLKKRYAQDGLKPPLDFSQFRDFAQLLMEKNLGYFLAIHTKSGELLAGSFLFGKGKFIHGLFTARAEGKEGNQASLLLFWETCRWANQQGFRIFDLGGAMHANIAFFKLRIGAHLVTYYRLHYFKAFYIRWLHTLANWRNKLHRSLNF